MPYRSRLKLATISLVQKSALSFLTIRSVTIRNLTTRALTSWFLITTSALVFSLPEDSQQPINIQSDRAAQKVLKDGTEKTEYFGKVVITQGSLKISGEHIIIHSKNRKVVKITAIGTPARFQQQSDPTKSPMRAKADNINYQLALDKIVLANSAVIEQDGNTVSGERIEYNIASEKVSASRGTSNDTRVHMVLTPTSKKESPQ
jgi:lipopolysaccharide export system protein LptA